ncbi:MAG: L,D-transpeptidase family protein [Steroidobacteraceae bacterium]
MKHRWPVILAVLALSGAARAEPDLPYAAGAAAPLPLSQLPTADRIVVRKSERRMYLMHAGQTLRTYKVSLGLMPVGQKERAGDYRTPEGSYQLVRRNPHSDYFLSLQVSYPNDEDMRRAKQNGWDPGGSIMIHGLPNTPRHSNDYYTSQDWTDGCIALSNSDMLELWLLTQNNIPIEIAP